MAANEHDSELGNVLGGNTQDADTLCESQHSIRGEDVLVTLVSRNSRASRAGSHSTSSTGPQGTDHTRWSLFKLDQ